MPILHYLYYFYFSIVKSDSKVYHDCVSSDEHVLPAQSYKSGEQLALQEIATLREIDETRRFGVRVKVGVAEIKPNSVGGYTIQNGEIDGLDFKGLEWTGDSRLGYGMDIGRYSLGDRGGNAAPQLGRRHCMLEISPTGDISFRNIKAKNGSMQATGFGLEEVTSTSIHRGTPASFVLPLRPKYNVYLVINVESDPKNTEQIRASNNELAHKKLNEILNIDIRGGKIPLNLIDSYLKWTLEAAKGLENEPGYIKAAEVVKSIIHERNYTEEHVQGLDIRTGQPAVYKEVGSREKYASGIELVELLKELDKKTTELQSEGSLPYEKQELIETLHSFKQSLGTSKRIRENLTRKPKS